MWIRENTHQHTHAQVSKPYHEILSDLCESFCFSLQSRYTITLENSEGLPHTVQKNIPENVSTYLLFISQTLLYRYIFFIQRDFMVLLLLQSEES